MPNNKKKTVKSIKDRDSAHPYSRKAQQYRRALHREEKVARSKSSKDGERARIVDKILFFKYLLEDDKKVATKEEMHDFIQTYLDRYDEEYNELVADQRKGRPSPPRLTLLESLREKEAKDYRLIGVELPDLTIPANVTILRSWEGDFNAVKLIKMVTLKHPDTIKQQGTEKAKRIEEESERQMAALEKRAMKGAMIDTTVLPKTMIAQSFMKNDMEIS